MATDAGDDAASGALGVLGSVWEDPRVEVFRSDDGMPMMRCTYCKNAKNEWIKNASKMLWHLTGTSSKGISKCKAIPEDRKARHMNLLSQKTLTKEQKETSRTHAAQQVDNLQANALQHGTSLLCFVYSRVELPS